MTAAARSLYIYYRVTPADLARAVASVRALQADLCARHPGLQAQVLRRVEAAPDGMPAQDADRPVTLMEVYAAEPGVDDALLGEIEAAAAAQRPQFGTSARHLELFEPCG